MRRVTGGVELFIGIGVLTIAAPLLLAGCAVNASIEYANCLTNDDGECILLDDVERILADDSTDDSKRQSLRALGIEDEELIDALIDS